MMAPAEKGADVLEVEVVPGVLGLEALAMVGDDPPGHVAMGSLGEADRPVQHLDSVRCLLICSEFVMKEEP